jgi:dihydroorotate dehydrogenase
MIDAFKLAKPILMRLPAETAHNLTLRALESGLVPAPPPVLDPILRTKLFGHPLLSPLGLAAGFDKNARVFHRLYEFGFGFVEIGGVTPRPQAGNVRPRLFRLPEDQAVVNRMGFNNEGADVVGMRVLARRREGRMLGINLASNSDSADPAADFVSLIEKFCDLADFLTIDISCPNTANGKLFQRREPLEDLLGRINELFETVDGLPRPPLVAKIAPDLTDEELVDIVAAVIKYGLDGMTVSNTTAARPAGLKSSFANERGGLSGRPLFDSATRLLGEVRRLAAGRLTLIGVGGIMSGADAYAKVRAGASALQLYTGLVYQGPALIGRIQRELADLLRADGFDSIGAACGRE